MEYYSALKRNPEVLTHDPACTHQHGWTLKAFSQVKEARHKRTNVVGFHLHEMAITDKSIETESRSVVARG